MCINKNSELSTNVEITKGSSFLHFLIFIDVKTSSIMNANDEAFLWIIQNQKKIHEEYIKEIS